MSSTISVATRQRGNEMCPVGGWLKSLPFFMCTITGKTRAVEVLWQDFFSNTSLWWDHRPEKRNPRFPDFKHKKTGDSLWLADARNLPWVQAGLAAIPPGTLQPGVFAWAQKLKRYVKARQYQKTLDVFFEMQQERIPPDTWTFLPVLKACAGLEALEEGKRIHTQIIQVGCESNVYVATCLVDMYAKCGSIEDACRVFNKMQERSVASWSSMIVGYVKSGQGLKAMKLFADMEQEGVEPDAITFVGLLNACASVGALKEGRDVHDQIIRRGCESDAYIGSSLVHMYAKCGSIKDAWSVFSNMQEHDVVTWSAMIGGYAKTGQGQKAIELFQKMEEEGVEPDAVTFVGVLNACASVLALEEGRRIHVKILERGCESVYIGNCLVDMYAKCESMHESWSVFSKMRSHNVVSWSAIIGGYAKSGQGLKALELFWRMQQEGVEPNAVTFVGVLTACASVGDIEEGRRVHEQIIKRDCESGVQVGSCLVDMYAKCGSIEDAWNVFNKIGKHNVVTWTAMIVGYVKSGQGLKAMELFAKMKQEGVEPNAVTFVGVLNACANVAALDDGRRVHKQIIQRGLESDVCLGSCLVDMYAKCGSIEDARRMFNKMQERNVVTWSAMIGGYAMHGHAKEAIELFEQMEKEGLEIDGITFTCLLSACSHGGLVNEGLRYFESMSSCFNILPTKEHYACMVDLLGRAGRLAEAEELTIKMPLDTHVSVWVSLLGGSSIHGNIEMAERAAKRCWELDPENTSGHVLLSNIYAGIGKWDRIAATGE